MQLLRQFAKACAKKIIGIFLIFSLLVSNLGFAFNVHYCDNKIASVSLNTAASIEEDCCGMVEQKSHCCKDRVVVVHKKSDLVMTKSFSFQTEAIPVLNEWQPIATDAKLLVQKSAITRYYCDSNAPPLFKLYSQYLFYDRF